MTVILEAIVGSQAYGLAHAGSDEDRLGIFVAPMNYLLGLSWNPHRETIESHNPDYVAHEVGKFCRKALGCNPTLVELLWLTDYTILTPRGQALIQIREKFLSTSAVRNAFGGYAKKQVERLDRRDDDTFSSATRSRTAKHARHCMRLLWQGHQLLTEGRLDVRLTEEQAGRCRSLGVLAATQKAEFIKRFHEEDAYMREATSVLPDQPDTEMVQDTLLDIRWDTL